ncbi:YeeE/YedE family protein [Nioella nitratireducens]|uniref:YeeE/YedE family protein n=1 Tax=Nioella nitratireducens TaxID=1287720 RepID=UPI0008FD1A63|nr:YeeE/YedE family protein [Nioella nitratireducens]
MPEFSDAALAALIGLATGLVLGLAARVGRFCTLAAIEDATYGGNGDRLRMWGIALGVAILGTHLLIATGLLVPGDVFYLRNWSIGGAVAGGLLFGVGMALAGNCGFGALARIGGGDFRSGVVVVTMGIMAYATISGPLAPLRVALLGAEPIPRDEAIGLGGLLARATGLPEWLFAAIVAAVLVILALRGADWGGFRRYALWAGVVGATITATWAAMQALNFHSFEAIPVADHSFAAPIGETILYVMTSTGSGLTFGIGSVLGVVLGAFLGSTRLGHFRWEACDDARELGRQLVGASMMGVGAVLAGGCSVGQGLSAFSVLAISAPIALLSIYAGARIGLHFLIYGQGFRNAD